MRHLALTALLLLAAACGAPAGSRLAPELILKDLGGKTVDLASFRGKPVLINFWATWCTTCREEMPALDGLYRRSGNKFTLLTVSLDDKPSEAVPPFAREHRLTFPLLIADRKALAAWAVRGLPTAFLIDADGRITHHWIGGLDVPAVENDILAVLNRRP